MNFPANYKNHAEYRADGIVHVIGVCASLVAAVTMVTYAMVNLPDHVLAPLLVYSFGLIATFAFSAAYNITKNPRPKAVLRRFDKAAIFLMIAGTYTPLALIGIGGSWGNFLVIGTWVIAAFGIVSTLSNSKILERLSLPLYLLQGWLVVIAIKPVFISLSGFAFAMIILGGLTYTTGVIFYRRDDWRYNRAIWHCFVLSAAIIHYFAILDIVQFA